MDNRDLNPWDMHRINLNRRQTPMVDIKVPKQEAKPAENLNNQTPIQQDNFSELPKREFQRRKTSSRKKILYYGLAAMLFLMLAALTVYYFDYRSRGEENNNNSTIEYMDSINEIRSVAVLPNVADSNATLSVVIDPEEAKQDPNPSFKFFNFFENAKAGDYLLHYPKIGKYVLYRPSTKQIVNMLTIPPEILNAENTSTTTGTSTATTTKSQ